jgi:hypothetical protein
MLKERNLTRGKDYGNDKDKVSVLCMQTVTSALFTLLRSLLSSECAVQAER